MRNQTWTNGKITRDIELYLEGNILKALDCLTGKVRSTTDEEREQFLYKPRRALLAEIDDLKTRLEKVEQR
ncbi:hypothetical protein LCGC14_2387210 [marine sediment metagenome]|uniref:Uncharacterized protein n=1 Tax=marine sediment metagenome TaxID=412755 RepID=A0A0F9CLE6_9ZZZZ